MQKTLRISTPYKLLFIAFVVLGIYYPAILSDFTQIDDPRIIGHIEDTNPSITDIFRPGSSHYYRPLIMLTFYVDKWIWGLEPTFMHLENILLHLINAILVYCLVKSLSFDRPDQASTGDIPFLAALLFAVHPVNTEAVSWVAGRTDPLATVFVLLSVLVIFQLKTGQVVVQALIVSFIIFIGCLAKEVAFFFFPVAWLLLLDRREVLTRQISLFKKSFQAIAVAVPLCFFSVLYLVLRQQALAKNDTSISTMLSNKIGWGETAFIGIKSFGFYLKKLFLPLPLNFAIVSYSDLYFWLGITAIILMAYVVTKRELAYDLLLGALFMLTPALVVAARKIAWTPVAERYLYCTSALFIVAVACWYITSDIMTKITWYVTPLVLCILSGAAFATVQRNLLWQDNFSFYEDAARQSPEFAKVASEYGIALMEQGRLDEAEKQFLHARSLDKNNFLVPLNQARIKLLQNNETGAIQILEHAYKDRKSTHPELLKFHARILESRFGAVQGRLEQRRIADELISIYSYVYTYTRDPFVAYRRGQLLLFIGNRDEAAIMFMCASHDAPKDSHYREAASKLAEKLRHK